MEILAFILYLIVAGACALIAEYVVPGVIPGGFLVAAVVGVIGARVGTSLMGGLGSSLAGVPLLPAILGSALLIFLMALVSHRAWLRRSLKTIRIDEERWLKSCLSLYCG